MSCAREAILGRVGSPYPRDQAEADREFSRLCTQLFFDWEEAEHWTVVLGHHPDYPKQKGLCIPLQQRLFVPSARDRLAWQTVVVHEICHAVTGTQHGQEFQDCISRAIDRAEAADDRELADALRRDDPAFRAGSGLA